LWFHVDGAYGGPAALVDDLKPQLAGIERADSIAFDPHKWLYTPRPGGCVLVRDLQSLTNAFSVHASYVDQDRERASRGLDLSSLGPEFTRGFGAFKVWFSLLAHGRSAYAKRIAHDTELARYMGHRVEQRPDFQLMAPVNLSICCFRYVPADLAGDGLSHEPYLDQINQRLVTELQLDGRTFCSNALLRGHYTLRACIVNFRTEVADVDALLDVAAELGAKLDASMRQEC
jgi:glutamate/tyrosine decarboxylase-like PLP-dependent enzyme